MNAGELTRLLACLRVIFVLLLVDALLAKNRGGGGDEAGLGVDGRMYEMLLRREDGVGNRNSQWHVCM